jgi:GrpB-like predicted nucleotidyltransferase (UPF0157 family)
MKRRTKEQPVTEEEIRAHTIGELKPLSGRILIADYDPQWVALCQGEADRICSVLGSRALQVEHVGSTSVPGFAAKPVIDILLCPIQTVRAGTAPNTGQKPAA